MEDQVRLPSCVVRRSCRLSWQSCVSFEMVLISPLILCIDCLSKGRCGSCWAISAMGIVEGVAYVTNGYIQSMSFQQLISCDGQNWGCDGGDVSTALQYAVSNSFGGLASLNDYPYGYTDYLGLGSPKCLTSPSMSLEVSSPKSWWHFRTHSTKASMFST